MALLQPDAIVYDRYRVVKLIGYGGMGAVYQAIDQRLGHWVALKQLLLGDGAADKAFEREARLLAGLRHRALVAVSDYFVDEAGQFLVMQYIPGDNLAELLLKQGRPFAADRVLGWADQLLHALEYLHRQQPPILHRDIKPQNIKVAGDDEIVLLDFGLARGAVRLQSRITTGGSIVGYTPQYAPLEQIQGRATDPRSDLYALGATLYHLLTGAPPVGAIDRAADLVNGLPDPLLAPAAIDPRVPEALSMALLQALSLAADRRPASASALRAMLREIATQPGAGEPRQISAVMLHPAPPALAALPDAPTLAVSQAGAQDANAAATGSTIPARRARTRSPLLWGGALAVVLLVAAAFALALRGRDAVRAGELPTAPPTLAALVADPPRSPTQAATAAPTEAPTQAATAAPTEAPTQAATAAPTEAPSAPPSAQPTRRAAGPTAAPTQRPAEAAPATSAPAPQPTADPRPIMPSFKGWNFEDARRRLVEELGISSVNITVVELNHSNLGDAFDDYLATEVIRTQPATGQPIDRGGGVTIFYRAARDDLKPRSSKPYPAP